VTSRALQSRKWQLIGKSQWCCSENCGHPLHAFNGQLDPRHAASKHTTAPINHTRPSPRTHSPDGATRARKQTSDYSLLLIYPLRKDDRLSWPSWLTCSGCFTYITGHLSATGRCAGQRKFTGRRPTFYHCATPITNSMPLHGCSDYNQSINQSIYFVYNAILRRYKSAPFVYHLAFYNCRL